MNDIFYLPRVKFLSTVATGQKLARRSFPDRNDVKRVLVIGKSAPKIRLNWIPGFLVQQPQDSPFFSPMEWLLERACK